MTPLLTQDANGDPTLRVENNAQISVEFLRDIRPLLQTRCVSCHQGASAAGNLDLSDTSIGSGGCPETIAASPRIRMPTSAIRR